MSDGIIDIHSHTLWQIDDGSPDLEETVDMCRLAYDSGTDILFMTPHLMYWENAEELYDERNEKCEIIREILADIGIPLKIKKGFEILCDDDIFQIKYLNPYTLCDSRYLLIEFDFFKPTVDDVISWCSYIKKSGFVPIIAHPERYKFMQTNPGCMDMLSDMGVLFQMNSGSAAGVFGRACREFALNMINKGFVDFIGSDAHDVLMRSTDIALSFDNYPDDINMDLLNKAAKENPFSIIENKQINVNRIMHFAEI